MNSPFTLRADQSPHDSFFAESSDQFVAANRVRLVRCTWAVAKVVLFSLLSFLAFTGIRGEIFYPELMSIFAIGVVAVWCLYQFRYYNLARYSLLLTCSAGILNLGIVYGASSYVHFLFIPCALASLTLFESLWERILCAAMTVVVMLTVSYIGDTYAHEALHGSTLRTYQLAFLFLVGWITYSLLKNFFTVDLDFRDRARKLYEQVDADTSNLQQQQLQLESRNEQLEQTNQELQASIARGVSVECQLNSSNEQLDQFAYAASHDLKEPLRSISSFVQLIRRKVASHSDEKLDEYFSIVVENTQRMSALLDDLLAYSRAGRMIDKQEQTDLQRALTMAFYPFRQKLEESGANVELSDEVLSIAAPNAVVGSILEQLISNAVKFADSERPLQLKVTLDREATAQEATLRITDNGIGIDSAYHERVFQLFERLNSTEHYPGSGIGLALVRKLVRLVDGDCGLEEVKDAPGVTIWVRFKTGMPVSLN